MVSDIAWERVNSYISHPIFKCRFVHCSISSPLRSLFISIAVAFVVPFQVRCVRCSFQLLLRSLFHFKSVAFVVPFQVRCLCCSISSPRGGHVIQILTVLLRSSEESYKETYSG